MLTKLLERKRHVTKAVETAKAKVRTLEAERTDAKGRLWTLEQERDKLTRSVYDEKARLLLEEDRRPIEQEIERLRLRQPIVAAEIMELETEIIPRLERHLQEAEQAATAEALTLRYEAAVRAAEGKEALLKQWNAALPDILRLADAIGQFNGRLEVHQRAYRDLALEQEQPIQATGEVIPASLTQALHTALKEAWQRGYAKGEGEANDVRLNQ